MTSFSSSRKIFFNFAVVLLSSLCFAPAQASTTLGGGDGVQYAQIAVALAKQGTCGQAYSYLATAKTDPYYIKATQEHSLYRDRWLSYKYNNIVRVIESAQTSLKHYCANYVAGSEEALDLSDTRTSSQTEETDAAATSAKELATTALTLAKTNKCEQAEETIKEATTQMSLGGTGAYVGNGTASFIVDTQIQIRALCHLTGEAATAQAVTNAVNGTNTDILKNETEAKDALQGSLRLAQVAVGWAQRGACANVTQSSGLIKSKVSYYKNDKVLTMQDSTVADLLAKAEQLCNAQSSSTTTGVTY